MGLFYPLSPLSSTSSFILGLGLGPVGTANPEPPGIGHLCTWEHGRVQSHRPGLGAGPAQPSSLPSPQFCPLPSNPLASAPLPQETQERGYGEEDLFPPGTKATRERSSRMLLF